VSAPHTTVRRRGVAARRISTCAGLAAALVVALAGHAPAQGQRDKSDVQPSEAVLRSLELAYLSDAERSARRVFHGLWTESDIAAAPARAQAALAAGVVNDPVFDDASVPAEDRAEARVLRGEPDAALELLADGASVRSLRLRALALEELGKIEEARDAATRASQALGTAQTPGDIVEAVRATRILARLEGRPGAQYQQMLDRLIGVQDQLDRLYWPAVAEQAELLYDKNNSSDAAKAALQTLELNPTSAIAWRVLGEIAVDSFNFPQAELVAQKLDAVTRRLSGDQSRRHPAGQIVLARGWLRQNDPEYARQHLATALAEIPLWREALALDAAAVATTYDYERTETMLREFDARSPGSALALYEVGRALSENRQYEKAAEFLQRAVERRPNWPQPVVELGLMEMQSGRDTLALTALRRAVELDPFNLRARNSLTLVEDLSTYATFESEHFIVRCKRGVDEVMGREMPAQLEEIHKIVSAGVDFTPPRKTVIELHPDHETFAVRITGMTGIHTIAAATGPVIAMEAPKIGKKNKGPYDWVRVLRHEYVHTVTLARTNNRIPLWFTEAAAVSLEGAPRDYNTVQLLARALETGTLFDLAQINIMFVRPKKPSDRAQAYAQGHWMYEYIKERWGSRAPLDLMDLYREGTRESDAFARVLGIDGETFLADFKVWAAKQAASWGMRPEPSIQALLVEATLSDPQRGKAALDSVVEFAARAGAKLGGLAGPGPFEFEAIEPDEATADRMLERYPDHPDWLEFKVMTRLAASGDEPTMEMSPLLERYARARPVDPMPHRHLARLYLASEQPGMAIPHLEYLDAREQNSPAYALELARQYAALGDWDRAGRKAERATQVSPFDANHREFAASVAIKRGDWDSAERHVRALVDLEPNQPVHKQRLDRLIEMRRTSETAPATPAP
jgi:cellulose synthase operon protein C